MGDFFEDLSEHLAIGGQSILEKHDPVFDANSDLKAIERRYEAASPGPWGWCKCGSCGLVNSHISTIAAVHGPCYQTSFGDPWPDNKLQAANQEFIANSITDIKMLLDEVKRLRKLLKFNG